MMVVDQKAGNSPRYTLPVMDSWIVGGDFNNLETLEDQQGRGLR